MIRKLMLRFVLGATIVVVASFGMTREASAFHFWWGGYWGPRVYSGYCCPTYVSYYSYPTCWDCCGCWSCGSCCGWSDCCGVVASSTHFVPAAPAQPAPPQAAPAQQQPTPAAPPAGGLEGVMPPPALDPTTQNGEAVLDVQVPSGARVFVNDLATRSAGSHRRYVARSLNAAKSYTFRVRVELDRDGELATETKVVRLTAGQKADLAFAAIAPSVLAKNSAKTVLTVHVPENARVWLAGNATTTAGSVRQFATSQLTAGETWDDYRVVAAIERDGQTVTLEKSITLEAGQPSEVRFEFEKPQVAEADEGEPQMPEQPVAQL